MLEGWTQIRGIAVTRVGRIPCADWLASPGKQRATGSKAQAKRDPVPAMSETASSDLARLMELGVTYAQATVLVSPKNAAKYLMKRNATEVTSGDMYAVLEHAARLGRLGRVGTRHYCLPGLEGKVRAAFDALGKPRRVKKKPASKAKKVSDSDWQAGPWWWRYEKPGGFHM